MKKANDNVMDLVLRSLAKSVGGDAFACFGSAGGDNNGEMREHLDVDELNTFAEGLVPEPARARYTKHLADCASCRGIVVSLTLASGAAGARPVAEGKTHLAIWRRFAALFSPLVLRYAVPALALAAVVGIGFLALRPDRDKEFVAGGYETPATSASEPAVTLQPSETSGKETLARETRLDSKTETVSTKEKKISVNDQNEIAKSPANTGLATSAPTLTEPSPASPRAAPAEAGRSQPLFAPEPMAGGQITSDVSKRSEVQKEEQPAGQEVQQRERDAYKLDASKESADKSSSTLAKAPSGPRRADAPVTDRRGYGVKNRKDSSEGEETRTVSGRSFRHQGNVWIDTGYESSQPTINVLRGSEQFRALVADEPQIRAVANQLGGEVILVWKGKAYRIR